MTTADPNYLYRPGLAYRIAFDWLAFNLSQHDGPVIALANSGFHRLELQRRLPFAHFSPPLHEELVVTGGATASDQRLLDSSLTARPAAVVVLEPNGDDISRLSELNGSLAPDGKLYAVVGGALRRFLAEHRDARFGTGLINHQFLLKRLNENGWRVTTRFGIHGVQAIVWHYMSSLASAARRPDLQDRWHYAMRNHFVETGVGSRISALLCLSAERAA